MVTSRLLTASAGFLLAVLWMDLMFDVQVLGHPADELPAPVLASIAAYYRRATTTSWPMSTLIALVMAVAVTSALVDLVRGEDALWRRALTLLLAVPPVALAIGRVVPSAVRLGAATDPAVVQSQLARSICHDHLLCLASITALLVLQLAARRH